VDEEAELIVKAELYPTEARDELLKLEGTDALSSGRRAGACGAGLDGVRDAGVI
jgi:hypothetical protein